MTDNTQTPDGQALENLQDVAEAHDLRTFPALPLPLGPAVHHPLGGLEELGDFADHTGAQVLYHQEHEDHLIVVLMAGAVAHVAFTPPHPDPDSVISQMQFSRDATITLDYADDDDNDDWNAPRREGPIDDEDFAAFAAAGYEPWKMPYRVRERWDTYVASEEIRQHTSTLVHDPQYVPRGRDRLDADELTSLLGTDNPVVHAAVYDKAWETYDREIRQGLVKKARKIAKQVVDHPKFRWETWLHSYGANFVVEVLTALGITVEDSRVLQEVPSIISDLSHRQPSTTANFIEDTAKDIWAALTPQERDAVGFDGRVASTQRRIEHLLPDDELDRTIELVIANVRRLAADEQLDRERRYATVARKLLASNTKASVARTLGISTSRVDRIVGENPIDVDLAFDDYLQQHL